MRAKETIEGSENRILEEHIPDSGECSQKD